MGTELDTLFRKATRLEQADVPEDAMLIYHQILLAYPANRRAQRGAARVAAGHETPDLGRLEAIKALYESGAAADALSHAMALAEDFPFHEPVWTLMGAASVALDRLDMAKRAFTQACILAPHKARTHGNLAQILQSSGAHHAAAESYVRAAALAPRNLDLRLNAGKALTLAGQSAAALEQFKAAHRLCPDNLLVHQSLGTAYLTLGHLTEACTHLSRVLEEDPDNLAVLNNLACAQLAIPEPSAAIATAQAALAIDPDYAAAHHTLANAQQSIGQLDLAVKSYERAVTLAPDMQYAQAHLLHFQAQIGDWRAFDAFPALAPRLGLEGDMVSPWSLLSFEDNPARHQMRAMHYAAQWTTQAPTLRSARSNGPLRIGYFSSDFYDHATLYLLSGVLAAHDRDSVELYLYRQNRPRPSTCLDRVLTRADHLRDMHDSSDAEITAQARKDRLDIAIDLKGYTNGARNGPFFSRLAPIQINYLGFPGTLGSDVYDYIIADDMVIPPEQRRHYTEHVIYMPDSYQPNDNQRQISRAPVTRSDYGLPEDALVLCCFNAGYKISPREFDIWMRVLRQIDHAVLWLLESNPWARANLVREAQARGIPAHRLIFAEKEPHDQHLARHRLADLFLDTFNVNAHTTASDALYTGVPVITRPGAQFAARVGASLCRAAGLAALIAPDDAAYEAMILHLAKNPERLAVLRAELHTATQTGPLYDTALYTRHLEAGLREAWEIWQRSEPARDIKVSPAAEQIRKAG